MNFQVVSCVLLVCVFSTAVHGQNVANLKKMSQTFCASAIKDAGAVEKGLTCFVNKTPKLGLTEMKDCFQNTTIGIIFNHGCDLLFDVKPLACLVQKAMGMNFPDRIKKQGYLSLYNALRSCLGNLLGGISIAKLVG